MTDRDYQHSRPLDVHCWSEHTEANKFVDYVYDTYLNNQSNENKRIKKRHLKVVHQLRDAGLVGFKEGWQDSGGEGT